MKKGFWIKVGIALAVVVALSIYFLNSLKPLAEVAEAKRSVAIRSVPGTLSVRAEKTMLIRSELEGRVMRSALELGKSVQSGEVLMVLDTRDIDIAIEKVQIQTDAARLTLEQGSRREFDLQSAKERLEEVKRRRDSGSASSVEVDQRERAVKEIERGIEQEERALAVSLAQLENELHALELKREKAEIVSPIDGVITDVFVYEGDLVSGGSEVAKMISADRIVEVKVSEENFSGIEEGQLARVKFLGYGDATFAAKVSKTLPVADPETQRYTVHLDVDIEEGRLFPGLTGEATITLDERADAIVIPNAAIIGNNVFLVRDGVVSVVRVEKGYSSLSSVEVRSGLSEGDLVIVDRLELFKEGDRVRTELRSF